MSGGVVFTVKYGVMMTALQRLLVGVGVMILLTYMVFAFVKWRRMWKMLRGMAGPPDLFPPWFNILCLRLRGAYDHIFDTSTGLFYVLQGLAKFYDKDRIFKAYIGFQPFVVLYKPETVEAVLNHSVNLKKPILYSLLHTWLGTGLLTSYGSKWKTHRKLLTPAFHFRILEDFLPVMNEQAEVFSNRLKGLLHKEVDIVPYVCGCTLDIICETAMGVKVQAQKDSTSAYVRNINSLGKQLIERVVRPWLWLDLTYLMTPEGKSFQHSVKSLHSFTKKVIRERKETLLAEKRLIDTTIEPEVKKRKFFLDLLLDHHITDNSISEEEIREEVDTFMFEGHDTTAAAICWSLYLLGLHPEQQKLVHAEMDSIFGNDRERYATMEDLRDMKYLECCIKESLRLYPSVPLIGREVDKEFVVNDRTVPVGTVVFVFSYMLHRDQKEFPQPEKFIPERFFTENCLGRHPFAYVPFSAGPRNCIGQRFALMEEKVVLSSFFRKCSIVSIEMRDQIQLAGEMVLRSKNGLKMRILPRS